VLALVGDPKPPTTSSFQLLDACCHVVLAEKAFLLRETDRGVLAQVLAQLSAQLLARF